MSISGDSRSDETFNRGPWRCSCVWRQNEFPFETNKVQFSISNWNSIFNFKLELSSYGDKASVSAVPTVGVPSNHNPLLREYNFVGFNKFPFLARADALLSIITSHGGPSALFLRVRWDFTYVQCDVLTDMYVTSCFKSNPRLSN